MMFLVNSEVFAHFTSFYKKKSKQILLRAVMHHGNFKQNLKDFWGVFTLFLSLNSRLL